MEKQLELPEVKNDVMHLDDRGFLFEILRTDDEMFTKFSQLYVSSIYPGVVKGFHKHNIQTDFATCVSGQIRMVLVYGGDDGNPIIKEYHLSQLSPKTIKIPPGVYHGWKCIGNEPAIIVNVISELFDEKHPDEVRLNPHNNPWGYSWDVVDK